MRNRYAGICGLCGRKVGPKEGRWRMFGKPSQDFEGLRCRPCSTTTRKGLRETAARLKGLEKSTANR